MTIKCSQCGVESEIEQAFTRERRWLGLQTRFYCPACQAKRHTREIKISLASWGLVAVGGLAFALFAPAPFNRAGQFLLQLVLVFLLTILLILPHELAHALAGRLLGLRVFAILIGFGKTLYTRRIGGIYWEARALPVGGFTVMGSPPVQFARLRIFLATLAGPAIHALVLPPLFVGQILLALLLPYAAPLRSLIGLLVWANVISLAGALFPAKSASAYGEVFSDGWRLFKIPFLSSAELHEHFASYYVQESVDAYRRGDLDAAKQWVEKGAALYPDDPIVLNGRGYILFQREEFAQARETLVALLQSHNAMKPEHKFVVLNNIASADILIGDPSLLAEADRYSAEAYQNAPWAPPIIGTRGAVLVEMGQLDEGIALLQEAMAKNTEAQGKAFEACYIAIGEKRRGNVAEGRRYLDMARSLDPRCPQIARAANELAGAAGTL
jgi:tetratricopeptide (TPR) repeat protein